MGKTLTSVSIPGNSEVTRISRPFTVIAALLIAALLMLFAACGEEQSTEERSGGSENDQAGTTLTPEEPAGATETTNEAPLAQSPEAEQGATAAPSQSTPVGTPIRSGERAAATTTPPQEQEGNRGDAPGTTPSTPAT